MVDRTEFTQHPAEKELGDIEEDGQTALFDVIGFQRDGVFVQPQRQVFLFDDTGDELARPVKVVDVSEAEDRTSGFTLINAGSLVDIFETYWRGGSPRGTLRSWS